MLALGHVPSKSLLQFIQLLPAGPDSGSSAYTASMSQSMGHPKALSARSVHTSTLNIACPQVRTSVVAPTSPKANHDGSASAAMDHDVYPSVQGYMIWLLRLTSLRVTAALSPIFRLICLPRCRAVSLLSFLLLLLLLSLGSSLGCALLRCRQPLLLLGLVLLLLKLALPLLINSFLPLLLSPANHAVLVEVPTASSSSAAGRVVHPCRNSLINHAQLVLQFQSILDAFLSSLFLLNWVCTLQYYGLFIALMRYYCLVSHPLKLSVVCSFTS
mmetsp:Transcript_21121/g.46256  ORF Transcript_21121/g.46256 Transcript_21121/m.46256 type:complete len:272 (+) Transcript_21121:180-995(+)